MTDMISREEVLNILHRLIVDTNPDNFDRPVTENIVWHIANGINVGVTRAEMEIEKLHPVDAMPVKRGTGGRMMSEWISVDERPPEFPCLVVWGTNAPCIPHGMISTEYAGKELYFDSEIADFACLGDVEDWLIPQNAITHWMPLPEPPNMSRRANDG